MDGQRKVGAAAGGHRTSRRLVRVGAVVAVLLLAVVVGTLTAHRPDGGGPDADAASPSGSATATPPSPVAPPGTVEPTTGSPAPTGPPWIPPAGAPRWTLKANDSVAFLPEPTLTRGGGGGLIFQPQWGQLAWYHWTDDPKDLSYAGCRNPKARRWDSIDLRQVGRKPRTYCQPDPADPTVVNYVRILGNHYDADPPSVDVQVWSFHP